MNYGLALIAFGLGFMIAFVLFVVLPVYGKAASDEQLSDELHKWQMAHKYHGYSMFDIAKHFYYKGRKSL